MREITGALSIKVLCTECFIILYILPCYSETFFRAFSITLFSWTFQATSCELMCEITGALSSQAILNVPQFCPFCHVFRHFYMFGVQLNFVNSFGYFLELTGALGIQALSCILNVQYFCPFCAVLTNFSMFFC